MINDQNKVKIINQYLEDDLPDKQRLAVEKLIKDDASFRSEVELQRKIQEMMPEGPIDEMDSTLEANSESEGDAKPALFREAMMSPKTLHYTIIALFTLFAIALLSILWLLS